jgi:tetratricopeptide (TPR) repeat protein
VLDRSAVLVCPDLEEAAADDDDMPEAAEDSAGEEEPSGNPPQLAARQRIADAQKRADSEPANHGAWVELGNAYYDADMPSQAIEAYGHALRLKPMDPDVLNDQGAMYRQFGDFTRALANFEKALAIDPANLESLYNRGFIYAFDVKRIDAALEVWQRYLELDNTSETAQQVESFVERYKNSPGNQ